MNIETVRRISLARHLYQLGISSLRSNNDLHLFSAVNLLQDSVEAFLIAVADHVKAAIDQNTNFDKYFVEINKKISPKEIPFKSTLLRLNRIRVDSKHYGIQPARDECDRLSVAVREFFDEVSTTHLGVSFSTVSAIDLLDDGPTKKILLEAKSAFEQGDHIECVISCRKAIYLEIEKDYNISIFKEKSDDPLNILGALSKSPTFARNSEYIAQYVCDPTDYIVYDHDKLNQDLQIHGIDNTAFWNIWRLTPEVYPNKDETWVVKHDLKKLDKKLLSDKIEYIFSTTVDIILSIHLTRQKTQYLDLQTYQIDLARENVSIFEKADKTSNVIGTIPIGMTKIITDYWVQGLKQDGQYWHVSDSVDEILLYGFIHNDDIKQT
jgi:hypothetical protein